MKSTTELQRDVLDELAWDPRLEEGGVGISVADGAVVLTGSVTSYAEKLAAESAVKRVHGVRSVRNELVVDPPWNAGWDDPLIAGAAREALRWNVHVPGDRVRAIVEDGWLTLAGEVSWPFQRAAAERAVRHLGGIRGVTNGIRVSPRVTTESVSERIEAAFRRNAVLDAQRVRVEVHGTRLVLRGRVASWAEREEAERIAWLGPGIASVDNQLTVDPAPPAFAADPHATG